MRHDVKANVAAELEWDPRVDSRDIAVAAHEGAVALRGTVGSVWQMRQAQNAARRVCGVTSVGNHLKVRASNCGPEEDAEIQTAVLQALMLNATIPATIQAEVVNSVVRLTGTATWQYQRDEAEIVCRAVAGVLGIADEITLIPVPAREDIQQSIISAYRRNARLTMELLSVDAQASGIVILSGTVPSWDVHEEAVAAAWSAAGVTRVYDRILVSGVPAMAPPASRHARPFHWRSWLPASCCHHVSGMSSSCGTSSASEPKRSGSCSTPVRSR